MFDKHLNIWIGSYLKSCIGPRIEKIDAGPFHLLFCVADHFEPRWEQPDYETECSRVERWCSEYPRFADLYRDASGRPPQHTFFYPEEEYRPEHLEKLAGLVRRGYGDVEVHLHHDADNAKALREKLERFKRRLSEEHGLLSRSAETGEVQFGFIHGNWALNNSRRDGRWCGVNNELIVLKESGCYADFTLPSAPSDTQTRKINSIYYAIDDPGRPKSHDTGVKVQAGVEGHGDLMIIQGPLTLNWRRRSRGFFPRIENGEIDADNPPLPDRVDLWVRQHIHVKGRPEWIFVKVHTHGATEHNAAVFLGEPFHVLHRHLQERYNDGVQFKLHYVTAREMYNVIKAAERGCQGDPRPYFDFTLVKSQMANRDVGIDHK